MSLQTWKEEFYPVPASQVPAREALAHSILKWRGLSKANLNRHSLVYDRTAAGISDGLISLHIDARSCALCCHHMHDNCPSCPLSQVRGGVRCDSRKSKESHEDRDAPFQYFARTGDPTPMLNWLLAAEGMVKQREEIERRTKAPKTQEQLDHEGAWAYVESNWRWCSATQKDWLLDAYLAGLKAGRCPSGHDC